MWKPYEVFAGFDLRSVLCPPCYDAVLGPFDKRTGDLLRKVAVKYVRARSGICAQCGLIALTEHPKTVDEVGQWRVLRRVLNTTDIEWMNLPPLLVGASIERVPESVRGRVKKYYESFPEPLFRGVGLFISGPTGVGKSGIAALLLKAARLEGFTCFWTTCHEIREAIRHDMKGYWGHDPDTTLWEHVHRANVLVIDGVGAQDAGQSFFGQAQLAGLLQHRNDSALPTYLTTTMAQSEFLDQFKAVSSGVLTLLLPLPVTGANQHRANTVSSFKQFLGD